MLSPEHRFSAYQVLTIGAIMLAKWGELVAAFGSRSPAIDCPDFNVRSITDVGC
jgi:hypothetical protein